MKKPKVDQGKCIGCGLCVGLAEKVFRMSEEGKAEIFGECDGWEGCEGKIQEAIDSCPLQAITWDKAKESLRGICPESK